MRIKDLYCTVLSIVCRVTDLEENEIFCSNKAVSYTHLTLPTNSRV